MPWANLLTGGQIELISMIVVRVATVYVDVSQYFMPIGPPRIISDSLILIRPALARVT